jgi:hypothetical protein
MASSQCGGGAGSGVGFFLKCRSSIPSSWPLVWAIAASKYKDPPGEIPISRKLPCAAVSSIISAEIAEFARHSSGIVPYRKGTNKQFAPKLQIHCLWIGMFFFWKMRSLMASMPSSRFASTSKTSSFRQFLMSIIPVCSQSKAQRDWSVIGTSIQYKLPALSLKPVICTRVHFPYPDVSPECGTVLTGSNHPECSSCKMGSITSILYQSWSTRRRVSAYGRRNAETSDAHTPHTLRAHSEDEPECKRSKLSATYSPGGALTLCVWRGADAIMALMCAPLDLAVRILVVAIRDLSRVCLCCVTCCVCVSCK